MKTLRITIVGKPNSGKSTLINNFFDTKVSIVSNKAKTTQKNIECCFCIDDKKIVIVDTPGFIREKENLLAKVMSNNIKNATSISDAFLYVFNLKNDINKELSLIKYYSKIAPLVLVLNKIDLVNKEKIAKTMSSIPNEILQDILDVLPISALLKSCIDDIKKSIQKLDTIESEDLFFLQSEEEKTNNFLCDIIREKALFCLRREVPHNIGVTITDKQEEGNLVKIYADMICGKNSQKAIIIGKCGNMLKEISTQARLDIEKFLKKKVYLKIFVKVRENFRNNKNYLNDLGFRV